MGGAKVWRPLYVLLTAFMLTGCQSADLAAGSLRQDPFSARSYMASRDIVAASSLMPVGEETGMPSGFAAFCRRNPDQCRDTPGGHTVLSLNEALWQTLWNVNATLNAAIKPMDDYTHYGQVDYWAIPTDGYGDCEDYALAKRKSLMDMGLPSQALRIAIAQLPDGEVHAVLTVATDRGDYVLDNMNSAVLPWGNTDYAWIMRQAASQRQWAYVGPEGRGLLAVAVAKIAPSKTEGLGARR